MNLRQVARFTGLAALTGAGLVALALLGYLLPTHQVAVLGLVVIIAIWTVGLTEPALLAVCCIPFVFLPARLSAAGVDLSVSDLALAAAVGPLLVSAQRPFSAPLRSLLWMSAAYQASIAFAVIAHPTRSGILEWFHEWLLVSGALILGWAIGRGGRARAGALTLAGCGVLLAALVTGAGILNFLRGDFSPVYLSWPMDFHKNFAGSLLCLVALIGYAHPEWSGLTRGAGLLVFWCCTLGLAFTQSRQAIIGLVIGIAILVVRTNRGAPRHRSHLILLAAVPVLVGLTVLARDQLRSGNEFNSANQRLDWFAESWRIWQTDPLFGVGLRWWYEGVFETQFQPPNAELEVVTSAGLIGLIGFLVLIAGSIRAVAHLPAAIGSVGVAVLVARFTQGQLDIFWVAGQSSLPFIVAGVCAGVAAHETARAAPRELTV